jgi:DUF2075 family protein
MLVYSDSKSQFISDVQSNHIDDIIHNAYKQKLGKSVAPNEVRSWRNSLQYMHNVLLKTKIPSNSGVSIEYKIPQTSKRIDFILTGKDDRKRDTAIIVELKQWSEVQKTEMDGIVKVFFGNKGIDLEHPSYKAWTYAALIEDFNETVRNENIQLLPCAYLHNCEYIDVIKHSFYNEYTSKAPAFLKDDVKRLSDFIDKFVKYGDSSGIMYRIDNGKISPSKNLADKLVSLLDGNQEFIMIDDQKIVYETALDLSSQASETNKIVLVVEGGPGTGKSVVAVNLLVELTKRKKVAQYVTKNAAPRTVYESKLTGAYKKSHISNLFKSSGSYTDCDDNIIDVLIVDEAHRLNEKSGLFQNLGENQIKEIIKASKHSIFFIDEDQRVTFKDIGEKEEILRWARKLGATTKTMELSSQFRCNGSDGYLAWIDNVLQLKETANEDINELHYDFQVMSSPNEMRDLIYKKNRLNNKARMVAGYCWDWITKNSTASGDYDIVISEHNFAMKWNLKNDGNLWILKPESVNEVGCIHTCQGLELDYIGVIIGPDLIVRNGKVVTIPEARAKTDASIKGYKSLKKKNQEIAAKKADLIIRNTYRTLMTRGQKGCYVFCTDSETNEYFKNALRQQVSQLSVETTTTGEGKIDTSYNKYSELTLALLNEKEARPYENCVPLYELEVAAGLFSEEQQVLEFLEECLWVELPEAFRPSDELFVAQVIGESMNHKIPNGSWCLFKLNPKGTRNGKIVLAQHRDISDTDTGGHYTVKRYESEKMVSYDDSWEHTKIILRPDSSNPKYEPIVIEPENSDDLRIIAEMVAVLT